MPERSIRVLLVDDHARIRQKLKILLEENANVQIIGEAENGEEAIALAATLHPSVIIMDINMPKMNGIEATARIKLQCPNLPIIGVSSSDRTAGNAMLKAGATMFLTKGSLVEALYPAIVEAVSGGYTENPSELR